jgi:hypothetical protein
MHSASGTLAVVAAPVPAADRRGLSQAWYSALHLAEGDVRGASSLRTRPLAAPGARVCGQPVVVPQPGAGAGRSGPARAGAAPAAAAAGVPPAPPGDRRDPPSRLARAILRAVAARRESGSTVAASENGRVHLVVRVDGQRTRIVALCREADRLAVERALGSARYALARSGALLDVAVRTER